MTKRYLFDHMTRWPEQWSPGDVVIFQSERVTVTVCELVETKARRPLRRSRVFHLLPRVWCV